MVIAFEFSKDFQTWTNKISNKRIEDFTVLDSYDVRQGYNLSDNPRASTFNMDIVSDYELAKALVEYRYIRIKKDGEITFVGQLSAESERRIETLTQQVLSIKYVHLLDKLTDKVFGNDDFELKFIEADSMDVLNNEDPSHSLVHILVNEYLLKDETIPFVFNNEYSQKVRIVSFVVRGKDNVWQVLNDLLREYGYIIRVENLTLTVVDILKEGTTGIELLDGADISAKNTAEPMTLPKVKYQESYVEKNVILYDEQYRIGGFLWWGKNLEGDLPLSFDEAEGKQMVNVTNVSYDDNSVKVLTEKAYINKGFRTFHRHISLEFGTLVLSGRETVKGDVTYAIYKNSVSPSAMPEGFTLSDEIVEPRYLYGAEQVERYLRSLARIKQFKKTEWSFYSKAKLKVDDIVRFKDIPDSTCRIFEVQDTLEMDGGYTYRAFPYPEDNIVFETTAESVSPSAFNYIKSIYPQEPIFIENNAYKKPVWRIYIQTAMNSTYPVVLVNNVPHEVKYDGKITRFYVDVALTDVDLNSLEVKASVAEDEEIANIPIYKTDNRPAIVEYRYSTSADDPYADDASILYGDKSLYYGEYLIGWGSELWTQRIPTGAKYEGVYLWKRTWNYDLGEWVHEMISSIEKLFQLYATPSIYTISKRNVVGTDVVIKAVVKGYASSKIEVFSDAGTIVKSEYPLQWNLSLPADISQTTVRIWAKIGEEETEVFLSGTVADDEPIYWGKLENAPEGQFVEGDYYLTMQNIPMRWNGVEWKVLDPVDSNYSEIINNVMADAFSDESQVIPAQSVIWQYVRNLMVNDATVDNLVARNLKVQDKLKKFITQIKGEDATPAVFDVQYDKNDGQGLQTIFKIVPSTGRIFMGRPNGDATAPETGFMYDPNNDTISTKGGKFRVRADGALEAIDVNINGSAVITEGIWKSRLDCPSFSSLPRSKGQEYKINCPSGAKGQYNAIYQFVRQNFGGNTGVVPCSHSIDARVKFANLTSGDRGRHYFYDQNLHEIAIIYATDTAFGPDYESPWSRNAFALTLKIGEGDVFKFKDIPNNSTGLEEGQVFRNNSGQLFIKTKNN